jgi:hypothetical protein
MLLFRSAAVAMALNLMPAPGFPQSQGRAPVAPEHQEMIAKRAKLKREDRRLS